MVTPLPRCVVAAPGSGHGKTTVSTGLMAALRESGLEVAGFKVGPDYIDPGYHCLATGRPGRNLDPYLCRPDQLAPLLLHGAATPTPADVAVVEGVMGLFDGQLGGNGFASTAHVATLLDAPVVLVVDASAASRTVAAVVHGLATFDPGVRVAGVIVNKVGSPRHAREVRDALDFTGVSVLGVLPRDSGLAVPSRHLGLVPAAELDDAAETLHLLARQIGEQVDLTGFLQIAHSAPAIDAVPWRPDAVVSPSSGARPVVALAGGRSFTFRYAETEELLRAAGCQPVTFDPVTDRSLPEDTAAIYLGGGFPQVHATDLAANTALRGDITAAIRAGVPTLAECAGLLYLCDVVEDQPMLNVVPAEAQMSPRLTLGYRTAVADRDQLLAPAGTRVTGHEFHRTRTTPDHGPRPAWLVEGRPSGFSLDPAGLGHDTVHASYLHLHWAGHPALAQRFSDAAHEFANTHQLANNGRPRPRRLGGADHRAAVDLHHHGDVDVAPDLVDLAVNVRLTSPPDFVRDAVNATTPSLGAYPRSNAAVSAIAAAHRVPGSHVLPTAGAAEAFTLIARAFTPRHPVVVHPQFTEPEAALRAAGHHPHRLLLTATDGFVLDPDLVDVDADLVMVGNPTNPTSVLHPAATVRRLMRPGRVLCVDEAFMDAVPGEPASLLSPEGSDDVSLSGVLVIRSLTKTWGLAGLRAGYVVGDPILVAALRRQQQPWSVSTPALAAMEACLTPEARAIAHEAAVRFQSDRAVLVRSLTSLGLQVVQPAAGPFVLVDTGGWPGEPGWVRRALRSSGFAVRRGETFPGLGPGWIRMAVRDEATTEAVIEALRHLRDSAHVNEAAVHIGASR
jgi:cobyrinic acid a,c-diamide synthase